MTHTERDDLNKRIAEDLEPKPPDFVFGDNRLTEGGRVYSPLKIWSSEWDPQRKPFPWYWAVCAKFFTDPACTLLLMGKLLQSERTVISKHGIGLRRTTPSWEPDDAVRTDINKDIGEAVALAYAAMRNLK